MRGGGEGKRTRPIHKKDIQGFRDVRGHQPSSLKVKLDAMKLTKYSKTVHTQDFKNRGHFCKDGSVSF